MIHEHIILYYAILNQATEIIVDLCIHLGWLSMQGRSFNPRQACITVWKAHCLYGSIMPFNELNFYLYNWWKQLAWPLFPNLVNVWEELSRKQFSIEATATPRNAIRCVLLCMWLYLVKFRVIFGPLYCFPMFLARLYRFSPYFAVHIGIVCVNSYHATSYSRHLLTAVIADAQKPNDAGVDANVKKAIVCYCLIVLGSLCPSH